MQEGEGVVIEKARLVVGGEPEKEEKPRVTIRVEYAMNGLAPGIELVAKREGNFPERKLLKLYPDGAIIRVAGALDFEGGLAEIFEGAPDGIQRVKVK